MPRELDPQKVYEFEKGFFGQEEADRRKKLKDAGKDPNENPNQDITQPIADRYQKIKNYFSK